MPRSSHWKDAGKWLLWACVFGLAPVWISLILIVFIDDLGSPSALFDQGQLALYAAGMAGTAQYLAAIDRDPPGMRFRTTINLLAFVVLAIAILTFTAVQTLEGISRISGSTLTAEPGPVIVASALIYVVSLGIAFGATVIDSERLESRYTSLQADHASSLADDFKGLK